MTATKPLASDLINKMKTGLHLKNTKSLLTHTVTRPFSFALLKQFRIDPEYPVFFGVELVVAGLERHILEDQQTRGHANRQAQDVQKRKNLIFPEVPKADEKVIADHGGDLVGETEQDS